MQAKDNRQSRRVARRRNSERQVPAPAHVRNAPERISPEDRRQARLVMIVFGLTFVGAIVVYVLMAAGEILG